MIETDYIVVGSGLSGAVIARRLFDCGFNVLIVERRNHIGGNVYDYVHPSGIRIHKYGPHYFRTNSEKVWSFVNKYSDFYKYEPCLKSHVDNKLENWPVSESYIKANIGTNWKPEFNRTPYNFEEASLSIMPKNVYEKFVKEYSEKQWGVDTKKLSVDLVKRFDVRKDDEPRLMRHKYQGIPVNGYSSFMSEMLKGIPIILNFDYLKHKSELLARKKLIYTGPIDEYYNYELGKLFYRGQKREHKYFDNINYYQPVGQVNYPKKSDGSHIRILEWKHMLPLEYASKIMGTVITYETPYTPTIPEDFEYPFPDKNNRSIYKIYLEKSKSDNNVIFCGRLGEYKYYDMDQAIENADIIAEKLIMNNK